MGRRAGVPALDQGVIRRKLAGARAAAPPPAGGAERALPLAFARAARDRINLQLDMGRVLAGRMSLTELLELPPDRALIAVLEGPREALGVLILSPELLAGLIEAQTLGRVNAQPVPPRKPTRTDAAMVADLIDAALAGMEATLLADEDLVWTDGFRYASFLDDARPLGLLLEDAALKVLRAECSLDGGMRSGGLILALPAEGHGRRPQRAAKADVPEPAAALVFAAALAEQVMVSECSLQAVLHRMTIPLSAVMGLKEGELVPLPMAALDRIELLGMDGRRLGQGRLGQHRGMRAVRLQGESGEALATALSPAGGTAAAPHSPTEAPARNDGTVLQRTGTG